MRISIFISECLVSRKNREKVKRWKWALLGFPRPSYSLPPWSLLIVHHHNLNQNHHHHDHHDHHDHHQGWTPTVESRSSSVNISSILNNFQVGYDRRVRPNYGKAKSCHKKRRTRAISRWNSCHRWCHHVHPLHWRSLGKVHGLHIRHVFQTGWHCTQCCFHIIDNHCNADLGGSTADLWKAPRPRQTNGELRSKSVNTSMVHIKKNGPYYGYVFAF